MIDTLSWVCLGVNVTCMCYQFYLLYLLYFKRSRSVEIELAVICPPGLMAKRGSYKGMPAVYISPTPPGEP